MTGMDGLASAMGDWNLRIEREHERTVEAIALADAALASSGMVLRNIDRTRQDVAESLRYGPR